jgi:hypothetical protein
VFCHKKLYEERKLKFVWLKKGFWVCQVRSCSFLFRFRYINIYVFDALNRCGTNIMLLLLSCFVTLVLRFISKMLWSFAIFPDFVAKQSSSGGVTWKEYKCIFNRNTQFKLRQLNSSRISCYRNPLCIIVQS